MDNGRLVHTLKELYNYMEDRADEQGRNEEYRFLFKIHKGLIELGAGSPEDDKFGVSSKEEPSGIRAFDSVEDAFDSIDPEGNRHNMSYNSDRPELNESIKKLKTDFKRFI